MIGLQPLSHPDLWATLVTEHTPRNLSLILQELRPTHASITLNPLDRGSPAAQRALFKRDIQGSDHDQMAARYIGGFASKQPHNPSPPPYFRVGTGINLVLAVEYDKDHPEQDPREGYTRDLQIAQSTMMARPYHPIFVDVLETATTHLSRMKEADTLCQGVNVVSFFSGVHVSDPTAQ